MLMAESPSSSTATDLHQEQRHALLPSNSNKSSSLIHNNTFSIHENAKTPSTYVFSSTKLPWEPRAWERQAGQPFAPRNEAQKIWRRPPLKNITGESNTKQKRWGIDRDDSVRPVKRLKLRQGGEGKENEIVDEGFVHVSKEREPEQSEGLQRKRHAVDGANILLHDIAESATIESPSPQITVLTTKGEHGSFVASTQITQSDLDQDQHLLATGESAFERLQPLDDHSEIQAHTQLEMEFDLNPEGELADAANQPSAGTLTHTDLGHLSSRGPAPSSLEAIVDQIFALPGEETQSRGQGSPDTQGDLSIGPVDARSVPSSRVDDEDTAFLQQFLQRAKEAREKNQSSSLCRPVGDRIKRHLIEQHLNTDSADGKRAHSPEPEDFSEIEDDEPTVTTTTFANPGTEKRIDQTPSSPSRRSHRLTKLPRPQRPTALPSNISLRRLNGTEFISMAKTRTEAQNAALLVRTNTRKNKDGALSVLNRLAQIKQDGAENGHQPAATEGSSSSDSSQQPDQQKKRSIKRRRPNVGGVRWADKIARFRDDDGEEYTVLPEDDDQGHERLTAKDYMAKTMAADEAKRGANETTPASESRDAKSKGSSLQPPGSPGSRTRAKLAQRSDPSVAPSIEEAEPQSGTVLGAETKMRTDSNKRKRKQTQGTVNGTPGPSRRNVEVLDVLREPSSGSDSVANTTRKIRMTRSSRGATPS